MPKLDRACARVRAGAVTEGMADLLVVRELRGDNLSDLERATLLSMLVECRLARGDLTNAVSLADELAPLLAGEGLPAALAHFAKAEISGALADPELALWHFLRAGELAPHATVDQLPWRAGAALAQLRNGDSRAAGELARRHVELAQRGGSPYAMAGALRALAVVDAGPDRVQHLLRARAVLADTVAERLAAQINTDLAGMLLISRAPDAEERAVALLRSAEDHAGRQELWPLHGRVRRILDRLGEQPRKVETEAIAALTFSERRVAKMAAEGLTNRQIASELVVTVKAVEWHLSHVYRKLGISSRTRLAGTLGATA